LLKRKRREAEVGAWGYYNPMLAYLVALSSMVQLGRSPEEQCKRGGVCMHTDVKLVSISGMMFWSVGTCSGRLEERNALLEGVRELEELEKSRCRK